MNGQNSKTRLLSMMSKLLCYCQLAAGLVPYFYISSGLGKEPVLHLGGVNQRDKEAQFLSQCTECSRRFAVISDSLCFCHHRLLKTLVWRGTWTSTGQSRKTMDALVRERIHIIQRLWKFLWPYRWYEDLQGIWGVTCSWKSCQFHWGIGYIIQINAKISSLHFKD